jgi:protein Tex
MVLPPAVFPAPARPAKEPGKRARRREKKAAAKLSIKQLASKTRKESKKRKREQKIESFKDYFNYQEPLSKIPPHRLLAINRGDRSKILRIKIEVEAETLLAKAEQVAIPAGHPHAEFLRGRLRDALNRLIVPSLEREVRRELTDYAELHAVQVFARNLRKLLLQPPVHNRRVLAIDPGFRSGCKLAALDEFGNVLGHTVIHVIGKEDVVRRGRQQMVEMILMYHIPVIAIGNGAACRETEKLVADVIANELKHREAHYIIVNEAGPASTRPVRWDVKNCPGSTPSCAAPCRSAAVCKTRCRNWSRSIRPTSAWGCTNTMSRRNTCRIRWTRWWNPA